MSSPDFAYRFDGHNRTAMVTADEQVRDLIYQLLFTVPGERVMRPTFGSGLLQLTFEPNSDELAAATHMLVVGALQEFLADRIVVHDATVENDGPTLNIAVEYTVIATRSRVTARFSGDVS